MARRDPPRIAAAHDPSRRIGPPHASVATCRVARRRPPRIAAAHDLVPANRRVARGRRLLSGSALSWIGRGASPTLNHLVAAIIAA